MGVSGVSEVRDGLVVWLPLILVIDAAEVLLTWGCSMASSRGSCDTDSRQVS